MPLRADRLDDRSAARQPLVLNPASRARRMLAVGAFWMLNVLLLYIHLIAWPQRFVPGQLVPHTIFAPIDYSYVDDDKLAQLTGNLSREEVVKTIDADYADQAVHRLDSFKDELIALRRAVSRLESTDPKTGQLIKDLADKYGLDPPAIANLLTPSSRQLEDVFSKARIELYQQMSNVVTPALITHLKEQSAPLLPTAPQNIYAYFLLPNLRVAPDPREQYSEYATVRVQRGDVIVREGDPATPMVIKQFDLLHANLVEQQFYRLGALALLLLGGILLWYQFLRHFSSPALMRLGALVQFGTLFTFFMAVGLLIARLPFDFIPYATAFAVTALACIVVLVYDTMFAAYFALGLAVVLATALAYESDLLIYLMGGALFPSVTITAWSRQRIHVLFALVMGLFNAALAVIVIMVGLQPYATDALMISGLSGFLATVFALGMVPVIETFSSQLTPGKLKELANPENELLKRLKREAHGTYAHSQMVADLVEEGCKEIGAHPMMARVGALYHDIGKLKRPSFFAENIHDLSRNPHIGLPPESSARILKDHVADGLTMAREAHLPRELHRFIVEHHGTYLIKYFYYAALQLHQQQPDKHPAPDESIFHYPGPIPQSRESGALMLADVTEAVTRARGEMEQEELEQLLDQIFAEKIEEGQLTQSMLTIGDLEVLKEAYARVVMGSMHHRVRYPHEIATGIQFHYVEPPVPAVPANEQY